MFSCSALWSERQGFGTKEFLKEIWTTPPTCLKTLLKNYVKNYVENYVKNYVKNYVRKLCFPVRPQSGKDRVFGQHNLKRFLRSAMAKQDPFP